MYYFTPAYHQWWCFNVCMTNTFNPALRLTEMVFRYDHHTNPTGKGDVQLAEPWRIHCDAQITAAAHTNMKGIKGQPTDSQRRLIWVLPLRHNLSSSVSKVDVFPKLANQLLQNSNLERSLLQLGTLFRLIREDCRWLIQAQGPKLDPWTNYKSFDTKCCLSGSNKGHCNFHGGYGSLLNHSLKPARWESINQIHLFGIDDHDFCANSSLLDKKFLSDTVTNIIFPTPFRWDAGAEIGFWHSSACGFGLITIGFIWAIHNSRSYIHLGIYFVFYSSCF